jgi:protein CpxP
MKPSIISIALALSIATIGIYSPLIIAQEAEQGTRQQSRAIGMLKQLGLSQEQKQDIAQIMRQTRQDNGVYKQDNRAQREQLKTLMAQDTWDSAVAQSIVEQNIAQSTQVQMNRAIARNQSYLVLNQEQKDELTLVREKNEKRGKGRKSKNKKRMGRGLNLNAEQRSAIGDIQASLKSKNIALKNTMRQYKHAQQAVVMSDSFNQETWLALQETMQPTLVAMRLNALEARFQMRSLLTQEQLDTLEQREAKKTKRNGKQGRGRDTRS